MNNYNSLRGHLEAQILEKIFGKLDYEKYVLSGKYIENSLIREKLRGFSNALNMIICDDYDKKVDMFSEIDNEENKDKNKNKDKEKNGEKDKDKNKDENENLILGFLSRRNVDICQRRLCGRIMLKMRL